MEVEVTLYTFLHLFDHSASLSATTLAILPVVIVLFDPSFVANAHLLYIDEDTEDLCALHFYISNSIIDNLKLKHEMSTYAAESYQFESKHLSLHEAKDACFQIDRITLLKKSTSLDQICC